MNTHKCGTKARSTAAWAMLLAGLAFSCAGRTQTADTGSLTQADAMADAMESADTAADLGAVESNKQQQRALVNARREAKLERLRDAKREPVAVRKALQPIAPSPTPLPEQRRAVAETAATVQKPVVAPAAVPVALLTEVSVSFKREPRLDVASTAEAWLPSISGAQEGEFTVVARVQARNAQGQHIDVRSEWKPADPAAVSVSAVAGDAVRITVRDVGESNLTVVGQGFSKELWISAVRQGKAMHVDIFQ